MLQSELLTILPVVAGAGVLHLVIHLYRLLQKKKSHNAPDSSELLRGPGQSLLNRIDAVSGDIHTSYAFLFLIPVAVGVIHLALSYMADVQESLLRVAVSAGIGMAYVLFYLGRLLVLSSKRRVYGHAYDGEVAVARQLNQLMEEGYHVYHDFPAEQSNIDHIVIGRAGVMAVETKTRSKGVGRNQKGDAVVTYDGRMLHFPKYSDHQIIDQAKRQAAWLSGWLSSSMGEDICARAIVALPGWFVKRTSADGIPVVNPKQFQTLFEHIKPRPLTERQMRRIVEQIDRQCRNTGIDGNICYPASS